MTKQIFRVVGAPPAPDALAATKLRWVRHFYTRFIPLYLLVLMIAAISGLPIWMWIVIGAGAASWLQGLISLSLRIRRES